MSEHAPIEPSTKTELTRTVFRFGLMGHAPYGYMSFDENGKIRGYKHPNEHSYTFKDGTLSIFSILWKRTSTFKESGHMKLLFTSSPIGEHVLEPVFSLGPLQGPEQAKRRPRVFVNTVAKAGTYLVAQALIETGYTPLHLHLASQHFHDNRGVPSDEIHWDPNARLVSCPASAVAGLIRPGEFMVGHVDDPNELGKMRSMGIEIISVIRHPYDQAASMMHFKATKIKPKPEDRVWQSMSGIDRFKSFLLVHDSDFWLTFSKTITEYFPFFRFEDLLKGKVPNNGQSRKLLSDLKDGIVKANGKKTSTYSGRDQSEVEAFYKDHVVRRYFDDCGLTEFANLHWPERADD